MSNESQPQKDDLPPDTTSTEPSTPQAPSEQGATPSDGVEVHVPPPKKVAKSKQKIPVVLHAEQDGIKKKVHPRFAKGKYTNIRLTSMYTILAGFLIMPWLKWDGHQAIWINIAEPKFYIFGASFMPQDFYFFAFIFMIAAILLFMVTVYAGRVFCGYVCPQTIYVHLFQYTEKLILGERNKRLKFDKEPMSGTKFAKLALLNGIFLIYSLITAFTFISLVVGVDAMLFNGHDLFFMGWGKFTWIFMGIITFVTYANAAYMREYMCMHFCPYGRFQSVMFDKDTFIVSYDYERGEPRGARKKGQDDGLGDCVDCTMCVQVCPTGIDIRNGLQVDCIQCAACIDACNEIMDKVGKPRGLVRYTTERQLVEKVPTKIISFRIFAYIFVLSALIATATYVFMSRTPLSVEIRHDRKQLSVVGRDGRIENSYVLKIVNKTEQKQTYHVKLEPTDGITLSSRFDKLSLSASEAYDWPISLYGEASKVKGRVPVTITIYSSDGKYSASATDVFVTQ